VVIRHKSFAVNRGQRNCDNEALIGPERMNGKEAARRGHKKGRIQKDGSCGPSVQHSGLKYYYLLLFFDGTGI
jgi:hypothetical protein